MYRQTLHSLLNSLEGRLDFEVSSPAKSNTDILRLDVSGIALDSRQVNAGDVFVALTGGNTDGHQYIPDALSRGAIAVVGEQQYGGLSTPYIRVIDSRQALALLSAAFYDHPARNLTVIGVTGTDGKTTTANLIYNILRVAGIQTGMISTVSAVIGERNLDTGFHVTTPEAPHVQRYLAQMVREGLTHVILEATSHGLAQHRVSACEFDIGVITNITHEHLDYHVTFQAYREAKARLFSHLISTGVKPRGNPRVAIINRDDGSYEYLSEIIHTLNAHTENRIRLVTYGMHPQADLRAEQCTYTSDSLRFIAVNQGFSMPIMARLIGEYNVSNCLAAIATTVMGMGVDLEAVRTGITSLENIPGRMEKIEFGQDYLAIVDFAHTPNALKRSLQAARMEINRAGKGGRLIAIFGSAGLRDRAKRRMMSEISAELADITVLTAEDPRTESLEGILAEMAEGAVAKGGKQGETFWRIPDRGEAIRFGINMACPGDIVIVLGKGHEQSMCFSDVEYPWDDRTAMRAALSERLGLPGPEMPFLPTRS